MMNSRPMPKPLTAATWLLAVALARTAAADASVEDRLKLLEERVKALEQENASLRADVAPKPAAPAPVRAAGKESKIDLGGLVQVQAEAGGKGDARFSDDNDRIYLRRARVNVSGRFLEDIEWRIEMEMSGSLPAASGLRGQLTDGFVLWKPRPTFELRAGQAKTPFGFEQLYSDSRLAFAERSYGSDRLTLGRQPGVMAGGSAFEKRLSWSLGAFHGNGTNSSGNDDDRFLVAARVAGTPATWKIGKRDASWSIGVDGYGSEDANVAQAPEFGFDSDPTRAGIDNIFRGRRHAKGADTQLVLGPVEAWGEWIEADFDPKNPAGAFDARSRSVQAAVHAWDDRLILGARWDDFDPNRSADGDATHSWTTGVAWLIRGSDLKLQANWLDVHGPAPYGEESKMIVRFQLVF
jgi:phosphate-selective porin